MDVTTCLLTAILIAAGFAQDDKYFNKGPEFEDTLSPEDFAKAPYVVDSDENSTGEYRNDLFEGDISNPKLTANNVNEFMQEGPAIDDPNGLMRNAIRNRYRLWPSMRVPYSISSRYSSYSRSRIAAAMSEYAKKTCIQFVPKTAQDYNYLFVMPDRGCYSMVGKMGGRQVLSLGGGCIHKGIIIHELMHAVGFFHEQSRNDRDGYITINWHNISPGMDGQFQKYSLRSIDHLGSKYDYGSVMHYSSTAFSRNGAPTISPKKSGVHIGQRRGFSSTDKFKVNKLYQCDGPTGIVTQPTTRKPWTPATAATMAPPTGKCSNRRPDCAFLAKSRNWCNANPSWMKQFCPAACGECPSPSPSPPTTSVIKKGSCSDKKDWCKRWANAGFCQGSFLTYMRTYCRKSCKFC